MAAKMSQATQEEKQDEPRKFAMHSGSDDEQEDDNEEKEAGALSALELSYEGLELSSIMAIPVATGMAMIEDNSRTGHISHQDTTSNFCRWTRSSPSGHKDWTEEGLEAEYGEHLRNLEKVLLELRQEQSEQAEERRSQSTCCPQEEEEGGGCSGCSCCWKTLRVEHGKVAPTPKVSVVSGFSNFSPYAAICRKYTALAV